jgi:vacuolar-type H+-ATPase subunit E/Vma4
MDALRTAFLADSTELAQRAVAEARQADADRVEAARVRAEELMRAARPAGEAAVLPDVARIHAAAARHARQLLLGAQREVFEEFRREALRAALELRGSPSYPGLLDELSRRARTQLGEAAELDVDPAGSGGVIARDGDRRVDYSLPALVERCIAALGDRVEELWR